MSQKVREDLLPRLFADEGRRGELEGGQVEDVTV
jgi:hypothetical protein